MAKENTIRKLLDDSGSVGIGSNSSRCPSIEFEVLQISAVSFRLRVSLILC